MIDQAGLSGPIGEFGGVHKISVVPQRNSGACRRDVEYRLCVLPCRRPGGRVAAVADRDMSGHRSESLFVEHLADQTQILEHQYLRAVGDCDPGGLLAAVLQRVEAVVGEFRDILAGRPDTEDAAFFPG